MRKLLILLVLASVSTGCWHSRDAGKDLEAWAVEQYRWSTDINQVVMAYFSGVDPLYITTLRHNIDGLCEKLGLSEKDCDKYDPGIDVAYIKFLRKSIPDLCEKAGLTAAECDELDPGPGDKVGDPDPPPPWPRP